MSRIEVVKSDVWEIVWFSEYGAEVVDEFETKEEAEQMAEEYKMAFGCQRF